jgi:hypothetical protein
MGRLALLTMSPFSPLAMFAAHACLPPSARPLQPRSCRIQDIIQKSLRNVSSLEEPRHGEKGQRT